MSEFSESFHCYGERSAVVSLLRSLGTSGTIVANNDRCVSFVVDEPERDEEIIAACRGVLARYYYGDDHGIWVRFYLDGQRLASLALVWDQDVSSAEEPSPDPPAVLVKKLLAAEVVSAEEAESLRHLLDAFSPRDREACSSVGETVAKLLGLAAYKRISTDDVALQSLDDLRRKYPSAEVVPPLGPN